MPALAIGVTFTSTPAEAMFAGTLPNDTDGLSDAARTCGSAVGVGLAVTSPPTVTVAVALATAVGDALAGGVGGGGGGGGAGESAAAAVVGRGRGAGLPGRVRRHRGQRARDARDVPRDRVVELVRLGGHAADLPRAVVERDVVDAEVIARRRRDRHLVAVVVAGRVGRDRHRRRGVVHRAGHVGDREFAAVW